MPVTIHQMLRSNVSVKRLENHDLRCNKTGSECRNTIFKFTDLRDIPKSNTEEGSSTHNFCAFEMLSSCKFYDKRLPRSFTLKHLINLNTLPKITAFITGSDFFPDI